MTEKLSVADLQEMKRQGKKICAGICYDSQMAIILEAAGADMITVGDSLGHRFLGHPTPYEVSVDEMVLFCRAVSMETRRAVINCDLPFGPVQLGVGEALKASVRLIKEGHADMVKVDNSEDNLPTIQALVDVGIPVFAQFGFSPQAMLGRGGMQYPSDEFLEGAMPGLVELGIELEAMGVAALDVTAVNGRVYGAISSAVKIPVLGGAGTKEADGKIVGFSYVVPPDGLDGAARNATHRVAQFAYGEAKSGFGEIRGWGS